MSTISNLAKMNARVILNRYRKFGNFRYNHQIDKTITQHSIAMAELASKYNYANDYITCTALLFNYDLIMRNAPYNKNVYNTTYELRNLGVPNEVLEPIHMFTYLHHPKAKLYLDKCAHAYTIDILDKVFTLADKYMPTTTLDDYHSPLTTIIDCESDD